MEQDSSSTKSEKEQQGHYNLLPYDGEVYVMKSFTDAAAAHHYFNTLRDTIQWQQGIVKMYGKLLKESRLSAWYGDEGMVYTYSGKVNVPHPWTAALLQLKERLKSEHYGDFNSCLLNYYRNGKDGMGFHADDEREIDQRAGIASLSFGGSRDFVFKHRLSGETIKILLSNGDLVLMQGETQKHWVHGLPKRAHADARINLTFRKIVSKK